jgi:hypothetical protein
MRANNLVPILAMASFAEAQSPWLMDEGYAARRGTRYKGSGTGKTRHKVAKSRAKAKAARKARRNHRSKP